MSNESDDLLSHRDDCTGVELEDDCAPVSGDWNQPSRAFVSEARDELRVELGQEPPWCRIHERAWKLIEEDAE